MNKNLFGFWIYLMTDCILFASLFAAYAVLHTNTNGGPSATELFSLPYILIETLLLLTSSFTVGLATLAVHEKKLQKSLIWLGTTFVLGLSFLVMEVHEFQKLAHEGNSWQRSGFLSSYFTLVATHGLHIFIGLLWIVLLMALLAKRGITSKLTAKIKLVGMFWHFLDIIWIFIFTIVYLLGAAKS